MLKRIAKLALKKTAPSVADGLARVMSRRHVRRLERRIGLTRVRDDFVRRHGSRVLGGPFQGMVYVDRAVGSVSVPKLVGSYEAELHPWLDRIARRHYRSVVDVGCAEGYYAVGLARMLRVCKVVAFDTDPVARRLCAEMARLNAVEDRVKVCGTCDTKRLNECLDPPCLLICDCEGFELELLDPARSPRLARCDILVELHDAIRPGVSQTILRRFENTHDCSTAGTMQRRPSDYPCVKCLTEADQSLALSEMRDRSQRWAWFTTKHPEGHESAPLGGDSITWLRGQQSLEAASR